VFPSTPQDGDRDPWGPELSREIARSGTGRSSSGFYAGAPEREPGTAGLGLGRPESHEEVEDDHHHDIEVVPVRRQLSVAIAGFAGLLAAGLILDVSKLMVLRASAEELAAHELYLDLLEKDARKPSVWRLAGSVN